MVPRRVRLLIPLLFSVTLVVAWPRVLPAQAPDPTDAFFNDGVVHEIRLAVNTRDWQSLKDHFQENTYYPADLNWVDGGQVVRYIGIRSRGNGSRRPQKPSLRLDMNRYTDGQQFLGLKSFILRNNSQDPTNLRERVSMLFFRRLGIAAMREAHAKLYVNNEYAGLYTIVEAPDKDFLGRNFTDKEGWLYNYSFDDEAVLAGAQPFIFQNLGSDPAAYCPDPFKPETHETDPQCEYIVRFVQAVNDTGAAWQQRMAEFLDVPKFIRRLAVENFLAEQDGLTGDYGPNNFYFYRFTGTSLFTFIPWDKSNTFWQTADYGIFRNITDGPENKRNRLVLRAFQEPNLYQLYLDSLLEAAASASEGATSTQSGWLEQEVNREYDQIRAAALTDTFVYSNAEFEQGIVDLKTIAHNRADAVRAQVAAAPRK
jgi:spore coat protein CotH